MHLFTRSVVLMLAISVCVETRYATGVELLRYRFEVGQEFEYTGHQESAYDGGKMIYDSTWSIWVVGANDDGGWRLIVRYSNAFRQFLDRLPNREITPQVHTILAWCDISPTGVIGENETLGYRMDLAKLLPRLPADQESVRAGWSSPEPLLNRTHRYRLLNSPGPGGEAAIEATQEGLETEVYDFDRTDTVTIDLKKGYPKRATTTTAQRSGHFKGEGKGELTLQKVTLHGTDWASTVRADAERFFAVQKRADPPDQPPDELEKTLDRIESDLKSAKQEITGAEFQKEIDELIQNYEKYRSHYLQSAKDRLAVLNHPAADWSCRDLNDHEHALKDYRGRVVVLDFWYRGCGWCIRAMPQIKEIAADFTDKPVTILGMNTDRDEADARFVIDKMKLNYTSLKASGVPEKYRVQGFPTLLIIDQEGIVRDIHVGYAADLKQKVSESIERLLATKK